MKRIRVIRCRELIKTKGACQAAFPAILLRFEPKPSAARPARVAHELRALFPEQVYGCQNTNTETVAGDPRVCRTLKPVPSAPVSRAVLGANALAPAPARLAQAKAKHQYRHAGPYRRPLPGENQTCEARSWSGNPAPGTLRAAARRVMVVLADRQIWLFRTTHTGP